MSRCRACDNVLRDEEIIWRPALGIWEDLCRKCRSSIHDPDNDLDIDNLGIDIVGDDYGQED